MNRLGERASLHCITVWCWDTQSKRVCKGFVALRQSPIWVLIMEDSCLAGFCLVCSGLALVLNLSTNRHRVQDVWLILVSMLKNYDYPENVN